MYAISVSPYACHSMGECRTDHPADERVAGQPRLIMALEQSRRYAAHAWNLERAVRSERDLDVRVIRVGPEASLRRRLPGLGNWSFRASLATKVGVRRRLAQREADALYIHSQVAALLMVDVMRRVPTVVSLEATPRNVDDVARGYGHSRQGRSLEWIKWSVNRRAFEAARALVTWSHWARDSLINDYGVPREKVTVIRPGVDLSRFRPPAPKRTRTGPVRILFIGYDLGREGGEDLLLAMRELGPAAELDIVTGSPVLPPKGVHARVHTGVEPHSPLAVDLLQHADVFALPTRSETYAHMIGAALACGLPVVATRVGAIPELVRPGLNGLLVSPGAVEELAAALLTLVNDGRLRRRMGQSGLRLVREEHDAQINNGEIFALMRRLAGASSATGDSRGVAAPGRSLVQPAP
jgi:glycosyltransferase involved in cell wall biosynthesis